MDAAIVELDALPDSVRSAPEDDDLLRLARLRLVLGGRASVALVAGVEIGRARRKLGRASVDPLVHRPDAGAFAGGPQGGLVRAGS